MLQSEDKPVALIVDDDEVFRNRLCRALIDREWDATAVAGGEDALAAARDHSPDLILLDLRMMTPACRRCAPACGALWPAAEAVAEMPSVFTKFRRFMLA